ncbi:MAG: transglutaminase-like domain-containing protein, partial [Acidobacteriota bacterium]
AAEISATGSTRERIARLERHLLTQYSYTLDFVGRDGRRPIEDFLFEYRSGHCEYFATAMVLMLRSQGVPARFVTGFLGAEANPLEGYFVVRQQNAHAWVEAWTEEGGWEVWDPTPPEGRPAALERTWRLFAQQVWDYVVFRWDRYVLTYGAADQEGFFRGLRDRLAEAWRSLWDSEAAPSAQPEGDLPTVEIAEAAADEAPERSPLWQRPWVRWTGLGVFLMLALLAAHLARRRPLGPAEAYLELRSLLANDGLAIDAATAPLQIRRLGREHLPAAGEAISRLVDRYLVQSFGGRSEEVEAAASRADLNTVRQAAIERRRALRAAAQRNAAQRSAAQRNAAQQDSASTDRPRAA